MTQGVLGILGIASTITQKISTAVAVETAAVAAVVVRDVEVAAEISSIQS